MLIADAYPFSGGSPKDLMAYMARNHPSHRALRRRYLLTCHSLPCFDQSFPLSPFTRLDYEISTPRSSSI
jgi:hypothetical protein